MNSGGVHLFSNSTTQGLSLVSGIDIPASHVVTQGSYAYASSGDLGLSIIDFSQPKAPVLKSRIDEYGHVYDVVISGHVLYIALGDKGIKALDISNPDQIVELAGFVDSGRHVEVLVATDYSIIGASYLGQGSTPIHSIVSFNDVALKIISVEPKTRILSPNSEQQSQIHLRFNKAVDLWDDNKLKLSVKREDGAGLASDVELSNNDILVKLSTSGLVAGESVKLNVKPGIKSVKPLASGDAITLYETKSHSSYLFNFLPEQLDKLRLHQVLPRRVLVGEHKLMSLTLSGLPKHYDELALYLGGELATIKQVTQSPDNDALYLIEFTSPVIQQAGLYDLIAEVTVNGVELTARLRGAVAIDAELETISSTPLWTDVKGGEMIDLWGHGFEPGSSLTEGTQVWVGSAAANNISVLSSQHLRFSAPANPSGMKTVRVTSRAAQSTQNNLQLGYGLKALGKTQVSNTAPRKLIVDSQSGIALAASGLFRKPGYPNQQLFGSSIPDKTIAFTADFNDPFTPLTVGGVGSISNKDEDLEDLLEQVLIANIYAKDILDGDMSTEDIEYLRDHQPNPRGFSLDAVDIKPFELASLDSTAKRKTALLATGSGGVFTLNLDELNGITPLSREFVKGNGGLTLTATVTGKDLSVFSTSFDAGQPQSMISPCGSLGVGQEDSKLLSLNMADLSDPVVMLIWQHSGAGLQSLYLSENGLLYHGGSRNARVWNPDADCPFLDRYTIGDVQVKGGRR